MLMPLSPKSTVATLERDLLAAFYRPHRGFLCPGRIGQQLLGVGFAPLGDLLVFPTCIGVAAPGIDFGRNRLAGSAVPA